jgi:hypothetical protein
MVTTKDVEMCCCKLHLHARRAIESLIACCKKQEVTLEGISDYESFFKTITSNCSGNETTYINWICTPSKNSICDEIQDKWSNLVAIILLNSDPNTTVPLTQFLKKPHTTKKWKQIILLEPETRDVDLKFLVQFIEKLLPTIIHRRNQLKHYKNTVQECTDMFDCVEIDIDYSEKLTVPVKYEPQDLHWHNSQVIVHSGILKESGDKKLSSIHVR